MFDTWSNNNERNVAQMWQSLNQVDLSNSLTGYFSQARTGSEVLSLWWYNKGRGAGTTDEEELNKHLRQSHLILNPPLKHNHHRKKPVITKFSSRPSTSSIDASIHSSLTAHLFYVHRPFDHHLLHCCSSNPSVTRKYTKTVSSQQFALH